MCRLLNDPELSVTRGALREMLVRWIADGPRFVRECDQNIARRAPDTRRVRVRTRKEFVDLVFRYEFR